MFFFTMIDTRESELVPERAKGYELSAIVRVAFSGVVVPSSSTPGLLDFLTLSFVFNNIPGLFRKEAISSQLSAISRQPSLWAFVVTSNLTPRLLDSRLLDSSTPRLFDLVLCFQ